MICGCGVQNVHFRGSLEDWNLLYEKVKRLYNYSSEFDKWVNNIQYIISKFIETYKGNPDINFWNDGLH